MCLEVIKPQQEFTFDDFSGLNDINNRTQDAFRGHKTLSKVCIQKTMYLETKLQQPGCN